MNLAIFLEYDKELNVRGKNKKERFFDVFSSMQKSGDELLLSNTVKDCNEFFENETLGKWKVIATRYLKRKARVLVVLASRISVHLIFPQTLSKHHKLKVGIRFRL